jgi:hypothetical protein
VSIATPYRSVGPYCAGAPAIGKCWKLFHGVFEHAPIGLFDLVELMPSRDHDGDGALVAGRIAATVDGIDRAPNRGGMTVSQWLAPADAARRVK